MVSEEAEQRPLTIEDMLSRRIELRRQHEREMGITHRDGVPWHDAPIPRRLHRCTPQTTALNLRGGERIYRCACGAIALDEPRYWMERNSSRKER